MTTKFQVYKDVAGKFRFRLRAGNNKIVAVSEAYEQHTGCLNGVKSVKNNCKSEIEDTTIEGQKISNPKYQIFFDTKCGFRFNLIARNGEVVATSEGYEAKEGCLNGISVVQSSCDAETEDLTITQTQVPVETAVTDVATAGETAAPIVEMTGTKLELDNLPKLVTVGEILFFKGKLSDTGKGIAKAKISIREHDRSFLLDEILAVGYTKEDGSFELGWKARSVDWWDDTAEIYAQYDGDKEVKHLRTSIQNIVIK